ncbi:MULTISPECIES: LysR substrate-binding domain-containing protein [unclassified Pseudomonas]|uniref:LysR substrate-binding domain-containing protein n=1 Tax=unclassified Pseudomonas TaxID=196821 RepID=UPI000CD2A23E|nr:MULTISPECIES: LysR substrate-binding domain-containing protein [unclassified Pseudomonas]POA59639.1 LysR family transcriptional regulator [Pseudomonas sp. FW507-12TSA]
MKFSTQSIARKLKFHQLVVFEQVLQSGSLVRASQALNLTQPAVTKIIHELESYFEAPLLIRSNRGVTATELGHVVVQRAKSLLAELRALTDEVNAFQEGTSGQVMVGTLISASTSLLPRAIQLLKQQAPGVLVSLRVGQMDQLFPALAVGDVDLVVGRVPDDWQWRSEALEVEVLYREDLSIVAGARHPMHRQAPVSLQQLHAYPWVLPTRDSLLRRTCDRLFADNGLPTPDNVAESLSILTNITLMQDQRTVALMPFEASRQFIQAGMLKAFDLGTALQFGDIGCFSSAQRKLGPAARLFRQCLDQARNESITEEHPA